MGNTLAPLAPGTIVEIYYENTNTDVDVFNYGYVVKYSDKRQKYLINVMSISNTSKFVEELLLDKRPTNVKEIDANNLLELSPQSKFYKILFQEYYKANERAKNGGEEPEWTRQVKVYFYSN